MKEVRGEIMDFLGTSLHF